MMPSTIEYGLMLDAEQPITIRSQSAEVIAKAAGDHVGWWLVIDGIRKHGPFATIEHLRTWIRDNVERICEVGNG